MGVRRRYDTGQTGSGFTGKRFYPFVLLVFLFFCFAGVGSVGVLTVVSYGDGGEGAGGVDGGCGRGSRRHLLPATEGELITKTRPIGVFICQSHHPFKRICFLVRFALAKRVVRKSSARKTRSWVPQGCIHLISPDSPMLVEKLY